MHLLKFGHAPSLNFRLKAQEEPKYCKSVLGKDINIEMQAPRGISNHLALPPTQSRKTPSQHPRKMVPHL